MPCQKYSNSRVLNRFVAQFFALPSGGCSKRQLCPLKCTFTTVFYRARSQIVRRGVFSSICERSKSTTTIYGCKCAFQTSKLPFAAPTIDSSKKNGDFLAVNVQTRPLLQHIATKKLLNQLLYTSVCVGRNFSINCGFSREKRGGLSD